MKALYISLCILFMVKIDILGQNVIPSTSNTLLQGNRIFNNEYWLFLRKTSSFPLYFEYFLFEDSSYCYISNSSNAYTELREGKYIYDSTTRVLNFNSPYVQSIKVLQKEYDEIVIMNLTDSSIYFMGRTIGITSDQYWHKGQKPLKNYYNFGELGYVQIIQYTKSRNEYICSYNLIDDILYLKVESLKIGDNNVKRFDTPINTYVRVEIKEETVCVEQVDLQNILDGKRNWGFKDENFLIKNLKEDTKPAKWDIYERVKKLDKIKVED